MSKKRIVGAITSAIVIGGIAIGGLLCVERIPAGYVGVQYSTYGGVKDEILTQGWKFVSPTIKTTLYSVATEVFLMSADSKEGSLDDESFKVTCSDGEITVDFELQYTFLPENVTKVFTKYRGVDGEKVVSVNLRSKIKTIVNEVLSEYSVLEAHLEKKTEINVKLTEVMRERLAEYGLYVESATLPRTAVSPEVSAAIENRTKMAQELEAEKMKQEKAKVEQETVKIEAETERIKNQEISKSLTKEMLTQQWIKKWDGKLPTVMSGDSGIMLDLEALQSAAEASKGTE